MNQTFLLYFIIFTFDPPPKFYIILVLKNTLLNQVKILSFPLVSLKSNIIKELKKQCRII